MLVGKDLTSVELADLSTRWIDSVYARKANIRKVDHFDGKELVGGKRGDFAGKAFPYYLPETQHEVTWRLRRDNPEIDLRNGKPKAKYLSPPGDRNRIYFPVGTTLAELQDTSIPLLIVEGEFKAIAMRRLAEWMVRNGMPRFIPIALSGVWNFMGTVGQTTNQHGTRVAVKGLITDFDLIVLAGRKIVIAFDADLASKDKVRAARHVLSIELRGLGGHVGYLVWDPKDGKGPDDWVANVGPEKVLDAIAEVRFNAVTDWQAKLLCTDTGKPKALIENAHIALEHAPELAGVRLDEFSGRIVRPARLPWPGTSPYWTDIDDIDLACWLQRHHVEVSIETAHSAMKSSAAQNSFHPVREYLESLQWDGEPRVDAWLTHYLGVEASNYVCAAGRCWLISAVARILQPGCKADAALLLIGPQGARKSTACRILGAPWFSDNMPDLNHKDAQQHLKGHWILEMGELAALNRAELSTVRSWMSRSEDEYRPAYGRQPVYLPRQCVFIATSNEGEPLKDTTGNRRFWPVEVGLIDTDALAADRDQLWAEAVELFRNGVLWWFTDEAIIRDALAEQAARVDQPVWQDLVEAYCHNTDGIVTVDEILEHAIKKDRDKRTQADKNMVVKCLQSMKWRLTMRRINRKKTKVYIDPESEHWLQKDPEEQMELKEG
jgi:predicted P-loop ATPase